MNQKRMRQSPERIRLRVAALADRSSALEEANTRIAYAMKLLREAYYPSGANALKDVRADIRTKLQVYHDELERLEAMLSSPRSRPS